MTHDYQTGFPDLDSTPELLPKQAGANHRGLGDSLNHLIELLETNNLPFGDLERFRRKHARYLNLERSRELNCIAAVREWADTRFNPKWISWKNHITNKQFLPNTPADACPQLIETVDDIMLIVRMCRKLSKVDIDIRSNENGICFSVTFIGQLRQAELRMIEDAGLAYSLNASCDPKSHIKTSINSSLHATEVQSTALFKTQEADSK